MSRLSDAILAEPTGRAVARRRGAVLDYEVSNDLPAPVLVDVLHQYAFRVSLAVRVAIKPYDQGAYENAGRTARRLICEEVFGEFRDPISRIEVALLESDVDAALGLLHDLRRAMLGE